MLTARSAVIAVSIGVLLLGGFALWERRRRRKKPAATPADSARSAAIAAERAQTRKAVNVATDLLPDGALPSQECAHASGTYLAGSGDPSGEKHVSAVAVESWTSPVKVSGAGGRADNDTVAAWSGVVSPAAAVEEELAAPVCVRPCFSTADSVNLVDGGAAVAESSVVEEHAYCLPPGGAIKAVPDSSTLDSISFSSYDMLSSPNEWIVIEGAHDSVAREEIVDSSGRSCFPEGDCADDYCDLSGQPDECVAVSSSCEQSACRAAVSASGDCGVSVSSTLLAHSAAKDSNRDAGAERPAAAARHQSDRAATPAFDASEQRASEGAATLLSCVAAALDARSPVALRGHAGTIAVESEPPRIDASSSRVDLDDVDLDDVDLDDVDLDDVDLGDDGAPSSPASASHPPSSERAPGLESAAPSERGGGVRPVPRVPQGEVLSVESFESVALVASNSLPDEQSSLASTGKSVGSADGETWAVGVGTSPAVILALTEDAISGWRGNETESGASSSEAEPSRGGLAARADADVAVARGEDRGAGGASAADVAATACASRPPLGAAMASADELSISSCTDLRRASDVASAVTAGANDESEAGSSSSGGQHSSFECVVAPSAGASAVSSSSGGSSDAAIAAPVPASSSDDDLATDKVSDASSVSSTTTTSCKAAAAAAPTLDMAADPELCVVGSRETPGNIPDSPDSSAVAAAARPDDGARSERFGAPGTPCERVTEHVTENDSSDTGPSQGGGRAADAGVKSNGHADPAAAAGSSHSRDGMQSSDSSVQVQPQDTQTKQVGAQQVFNFYLPTAMCGLFIGKKGRNVNHLKAKSGAFIHVEALPTTRDRHLCVIKGSAEAVRKAIDAIVERFPELGPVLTADAYAASTPIGAGAVNTFDISRLQLQLVPNSAVNVALQSVASATRIFVQLPTHPTYPSLDRLSSDLVDLYSGATAGDVPPPLPEPIGPGALCAVESEGAWYRASVVRQCERQYDDGAAESCVQLRYLDYGGYDTVPVTHVRQLRADFLSLPFQAVECLLAHVQPPETADSLSESNAISVLVSFSGGLLECINVGTDGESGLPLVDLYATSSGAAIYINQLVSDAGGMEWIN